MSELWYYVEGDETREPITFDELIAILSRLPSVRDVLVWREGFTDWVEAGNVREIVAKGALAAARCLRIAMAPPHRSNDETSIIRKDAR